MRLDKYLASTRVLKSRSLVKTAIDEGWVFVNSSSTKPSSTVKLGDVIEIDIPRFYKKIRVIGFPAKNMKKAEAVNLYELIEERKKELI